MEPPGDTDSGVAGEGHLGGAREDADRAGCRVVDVHGLAVAKLSSHALPIGGRDEGAVDDAEWVAEPAVGGGEDSDDLDVEGGQPLRRRRLRR